VGLVGIELVRPQDERCTDLEHGSELRVGLGNKPYRHCRDQLLGCGEMGDELISRGNLEHTGGMKRHIEHRGWDPSWAVPTEHDIDDLRERGWVRLDAPAKGKGRAFSLTGEGRLRGLKACRERAGVGRLPLSLEWALLEPALEAAVAGYELAGAPDGGIHTATIALPDGIAPTAIAELTRAGLLIDCEAEDDGSGGGVDQIDGPGFVRPSVDALSMRRGWPRRDADAAIERLVHALLEQAEATDDPEERTHLRKAADWLGRVGTGILTGVGSTIVTGQAGHLIS
jgi:hypothetical protein